MVRLTLYAHLILAGLLGALFPSEALRVVVGTNTAYVWSSYLVIGGALSLLGGVTDRWLGEYVGLTLLWSGVAFYSAVLGLDALTNDGHAFKAAGAALIAALALVLYDRWLDVRAIARAAHAVVPDDRD